MHEYGIVLTPWDELPHGVDAIVAAVSHREYLEMPLATMLEPLHKGGVFVDVKAAYDRGAIEAAGARLWRP